MGFKLYRSARVAAAVAGVLLAVRGVCATDTAGSEIAMVIADDLTKLSLEDLMNVEVTSVAKRKQRIAEAPAAIYVIGQEDIRRSGHSSIPELLRMAPGLDVARINANKWAISSRGFNDLYANKLLVLQDGRAVYTPLFSGVYWDTVDTVLEDLDRIEVIRGPGATLWGANAVNGVINITTRSARDTQGALFSGRTGTEEHVGAVRYGGKLDEQTFYRVYAKYRDVDNFDFPDGSEAHDGWDQLRGGFRIDRYASDQDTLTLQGDIYDGDAGNTLRLPSFMSPAFTDRVDNTVSASGGNILARWTHVVSEKSDFSVQFYYDRIERQDIQLGYEQDTLDIDFQHRFGLGERNEVIWGAGYRFVDDEIDSSEWMMFDPSRRNTSLLSAFIQDRLTIVPDRLYAFVGSKFEVNSYTGFEIQPSARILWTPNDRNSVWGAVSRAVRTPSRWEEDERLVFARGFDPTTGLPFTADTVGNIHQESESLTAFELGYRVQPTRQVSFDVAAFYNSYDSLRSYEMLPATFEATPPPPKIFVPFPLRNEIEGHTYGIEVAANWSVTENWRLMAGYSYLDSDFRDSTGLDGFSASALERNAPHNQFQLRSYLNITRDLELNAAMYYVDNVPLHDVPAYIRVDLGMTWRFSKHAELSVGVQNLFDDRHPEFGRPLFDEPTEIPRAVWVQMQWKI